jgi:hypothetical protein
MTFLDEVEQQLRASAAILGPAASRFVERLIHLIKRRV